MSKILLFACSVMLLVGATGQAAQKDEREKGPAVAIRGGDYSPRELRIKRGQTVVWTNYDDRDHTVTAKDGAFSSATLKKKQTFEHTFRRAGKYEYACKFHPRMKGTIIVE